jgi:hypothetical protein
LLLDFLRVPLRAPRRRVDWVKNDFVAVIKNKNSSNKIMKQKISRFPALSLAVVAMLAILNAPLSTAVAQGTAFSYQGRLQNNGSPASGTYTMTFMLFNTNASGVRRSSAAFKP